MRRHRTVRVSGTGSQVASIVVDYGPQVGVDPDATTDCPDSLEVHGVDLKMSDPAAATDVTVSGGGHED